MSESQSDYRPTIQLTSNPEDIATNVLSAADDELSTDTHADQWVAIGETIDKVIETHHVSQLEWAELMYIVEWISAEYDLHPQALTAHVVEDVPDLQFGTICHQLVRSVLQHVIQQEILEFDLSKGFDPFYGDIRTPSDTVGVDLGWFPMSPAYETYGRLIQGNQSELREAARTTIEAHYPLYLRLSLTEQSALIEHVVKSGEIDGKIEYGRAENAACEGLEQIVATFLWDILEDAIVESLESHFRPPDCYR
jgi:hypothetical protein